jgi:hypothetical protein
MSEPFKINRVLPPHELNARRARKRVVTTLPGIAHLPESSDTFHQPNPSPNDHVFNPGANPFTPHE